MSEDDLDQIEDPETLFRAATDAMNRHRENVDDMAAIRSASVSALYAQGYSYKELGEMLNISTPRAGQLVGVNGSAAVEVLRAWSAIEMNLTRIVQLYKPEETDETLGRAPVFHEALRILRESENVSPETLVDIDSIWHTRSRFVHGVIDIGVEEAEQLLDKAIHVNAVLTVWLHEATTLEYNASPRATLDAVEKARIEMAKIANEEAAQRKRASNSSKRIASAKSSARAKREQAAKTSSPSLARSRVRSAEAAEERAAVEEARLAVVSKKLGDLAKRKAVASKELEQAEAKAHTRRRSDEKRHARQHARLTSKAGSSYAGSGAPEPKLEKLRVLYLSADPEPDAYLRVDVEMREVQEAVKRATRRDLIEIDHRPASTPEDLLDGVSEIRPHVVHFAGHGGVASLLFDHGTVSGGAGKALSFDPLARVFAATDTPPALLVLSACDTLEGAETLLVSVPVVVAMHSVISDLAASSFAARFYSTIANGQSVRSALEMGRAAVELMDQDEKWTPHLIMRGGIDSSSLVLVAAPSD